MPRSLPISRRPGSRIIIPQRPSRPTLRRQRILGSAGAARTPRAPSILQSPTPRSRSRSRRRCRITRRLLPRKRKLLARRQRTLICRSSRRRTRPSWCRTRRRSSPRLARKRKLFRCVRIRSRSRRSLIIRRRLTVRPHHRIPILVEDLAIPLRRRRSRLPPRAQSQQPNPSRPHHHRPNPNPHIPLDDNRPPRGSPPSKTSLQGDLRSFHEMEDA